MAEMKILCAVVWFCFIVLTDKQTSAESKQLSYNTTWIRSTDFPTRANGRVDVSLPRIEYEEECFIRTPQGDVIKASNARLKGVKLHVRSYFVSCRITIGPMVDELLGTWTICGKYTTEDTEYDRCQSARIYWNMQSDRQPDVRGKINYKINDHGYTTIAIRDTGAVVACHIVTSNGEDLAANQNSTFPSIAITVKEPATCKFTIGPYKIYTEFSSNWDIYGIFSNSIEGLYEVHQPFSIGYDGKRAINYEYSSTELNPVTTKRTNTRDKRIKAEKLGSRMVSESSFNDKQRLPDINPETRFIDIGNNIYTASANAGRITERSHKNMNHNIKFEIHNDKIVVYPTKKVLDHLKRIAIDCLVVFGLLLVLLVVMMSFEYSV